MSKITHVCSLCNSPLVVSVRHDSDWGSSNVQYPLNDESFYPKEFVSEDNFFGDIECVYCYACHKFSNEAKK